MDTLIADAKNLENDGKPSFEYCAGSNLYMNDGVRFLMPGRDCASKLGTQALENNYMEDPSHYDLILEMGWPAYQEKYVDSHKTAQDQEDFNRSMELAGMFEEKYAASGLECYDWFSDVLMLNGGIYLLSMLRGFGPFLMDCRRRPEKVKEVMALIQDAELENMTMFADESTARFIYPNLCRTDCKTMR